MIIGQPPAWTKDAAEIVQSFLRSPVGTAALAHIAARRPKLTVGTDVNAAALAGSAAAGYERCIDNFLSLADIPAAEGDAKPADDNYPDIDDNSKWPEDKKPQPQKK
jgi:hypothetical protein